MSGTRPSRRAVLAGACTFGSVSLLGCLGIGGGDDPDDGTDVEDDRSGVDPDERSVQDDTPIELVEPDATVETGLAASNERITSLHGHDGHSHWHFEPLQIRRGDERTVRVRYLDENHEEFPLGPDEPFRTTVEVVDPSPSGFLKTSIDGDLVTFSGEAIGDGDLQFGLWRDDERVWGPPLLGIEVIDSNGTE